MKIIQTFLDLLLYWDDMFFSSHTNIRNMKYYVSTTETKTDAQIFALKCIRKSGRLDLQYEPRS
jgi:hypothetical protein